MRLLPFVLLLVPVLSQNCSDSPAGVTSGNEQPPSYLLGNCEVPSPSGAVCNLTCYTNTYYQSGSLTISCVSGSWTGATAVCTATPTAETPAQTCGTTVALGPPNGMEGSYTAYAGYWINFGFHYTTNQAASLLWQNPTGTFIYTCKGSSTYQYWSFTGQTVTYTGPAGQYGGGDEHVAWQTGFSVQLPPLCGVGQPIYSTTAGASFSATVFSNVPTCLSFQWHYRVPGAIGGTAGNVNLWSWCPQNLKNGQYGSTCGASWSSTQQYCVGCRSVAAEQAFSSSSGGIATYTIVGVVAIGVLVFLFYYSIRSAQRKSRRESDMAEKLEQEVAVSVDLDRPAAPSSASADTEGVTVGS